MAENSEGLETDVEDVEEKKHFQRIVNAFRCYRLHSLVRLCKTLKYTNSLPESHQTVLKNYKQHLEKVRVSIEHNFEIFKLIIQDVAHMFENADHSNDMKISSQVQATLSDMDKVQSLLKQVVREWSEEGEQERTTCFQPILNEIIARFPSREYNPRDIQILVPGAGLGRLAYEIARKGYTCQGNEFSLFMLFASNFILNKCKGVNLYHIYPWVHQYHNHLSSEDQIRAASFPDSDPSDLPPNSEFSMAAGNFVEIYTESDTWDCVVTCFFLDTANNVVLYIETIQNILKPGGYWINLGPLLYHYADLPNEDSIEPSYQEIRSIIQAYGFEFLKEETGLRTPYTQNPRSMMFYEYHSVFFVCRKTLS
ncbi:carnosine N-methyltransferase-like isoform X1 [Tachypleus tridentatus]|uniref:carnosine N-methyltransferase-like isoform X1 n=1 Tax=Tachypleus tridentatus TaxID=6853 RepID=UPI003FD614C1